MSQKPHYAKEIPESETQKFAKYLSEDEELIVATGYGHTYLRQKFMIQIMLPGAVYMLAGILLAYFQKFDLLYGFIGGIILAVASSTLQTWIIYQSNRYLLTTRRVMVKHGFFRVRLSSALYDKITHIEVDQGLIDRFLLHHGTIIVNTAGANKDELILKYVEYPLEFKNVLERLIHQEREYFRRNPEVLEEIEGELVDR
ncbi:hypothetical protein A2631_04800 [Candidatus Daviesbacteria bacterium RIFCSPHIGHO2_01_FULL_44_29]|uniref:YdbS-like PH domain-containing protein n=1 Tax=Candidatus Daviesbacteria bacterium RIFCSPHIGHO2_02_FULL_43_12 TaxID=1797776 RepID=A0A1F5KGU7_9BACT|nr:MAG: hypothetical protein A2631_04800 [Candidatus Daviesbacteria bacterium RIFCSPHIGHO2_01_FULL_44_29]OGE40040.1 MAG: hypothetical protein A3D25_04530 [Candidatus Daviesbacteria bacterium RIFCSPHIGHO2_02_FULL_43_12]OGE41478.1 MAG: hypothetical protein A3E86_05280 [Candidatus Daviesbacteria bacterium RIFCSPHIGHO2_12_FULL_47_45]OGE70279.1 MAG: hypothetical protein A3B55_01040 [Candidatus Daviesbacteria bacterium RIFCSPLOWO2_01_FULL_43_15]